MTIPFTDPGSSVPPPPSGPPGVPPAPDAISALKSVGVGNSAVQWVQAPNDLWVPKSVVTTAGDLIIATGNGAVGRLAAGAANTVLTGNGAGAAPSYRFPPMSLISSQVLAGTAASVTFSAIPGTFNHLRLLGIARGDAVATNVQFAILLNGDGGANYDLQSLTGQNAAAAASAAAASGGGVVGYIPAASCAAAHFAAFAVEIPAYALTTAQKVIRSSTGFADTAVANDIKAELVNNWRNTSAVTSITLVPSPGNLVGGSALYLYGIT